MIAITLRLATPNEAAIAAEHRAVMSHEVDVLRGKKPASPENVKLATKGFTEWAQRHITAGTYLHWLALDGDTVVGGAGLWLLDWAPSPHSPHRKRAHVMNVYVAPTHRQQGLARRLMTTILDHCREHGITVLQLYASDEARPLYESLGFRTDDMMVMRVK